LGRIARLRGCGGNFVDERARGVRMAQALVDVGGPELRALAASPYAAGRAVAAGGADAATGRGRLGDREPGEGAAGGEAGPALVAAIERLDGPDAAESIEAQQAILEAGATLSVAALIPAARRRLDAEPYALRLAVARALTALEGRPVRARPPGDGEGN